MTFVPVQPQMYTVAPFYAKTRSCKVEAHTTDWYPEYIPDHFNNLMNWFLLNSPPISQILRKSTPTFLSYSNNRQTDR